MRNKKEEDINQSTFCITSTSTIWGQVRQIPTHRFYKVSLMWRLYGRTFLSHYSFFGWQKGSRKSESDFSCTRERDQIHQL